VALPFDLPIPAEFTSRPIWTGSGFLVGDIMFPVLDYSENFAGWSDDLTALHENLVGDSHPIDMASRSYAIQQISDAVTESRQVLMEIGCSSGFLIKEIVSRFPNLVVIGADVVKAPLQRLAKTLPTLPLIRFDLLQNPLPNSCINFLIMLNVLEHIEDDLLALKNAYYLLKPGGSLIIEVPAGPCLYDSYDKQLYHFRRYTAVELQDKLNSVGFIVTRKSHLGFFIYPAFALVKIINKIGFKSNSSVETQVSRTSNSKLLSIIMNAESRLSKFFSYPFGVRVLITAKRPK
jgi:SAM-dependent methyltransferase